MKTVNKLLICLMLIGVVFGCSPKYTASFGPSQKFYDNGTKKNLTSHVDQKVHDVESFATDHREGSDLESITDSKPLAEQQTLASTVKQPDAMLPNVQELKDKYSKENRSASKKAFIKLSSKEKKSFVKEIKKDLKDLKKLKKKSSIENRKVYAGIIIALAGLVVALLVSGTIGGLGILVGVVLIAWGLIEQGTFS